MTEKYRTVSRPNFIASEVGLVAKTIEVPSTFATTVTENNRTIVKAGTYFTSPYKGLLLVDIDITDGDAIAPLMVSGQYIDANLPATVAAAASDLQIQGLFALAEGSITRPSFGDDSIKTQLTIGTVTAGTAVITWTTVANALSYDAYFSATSTGTFSKFTNVTAGSAAAATTGYYKVKCIGDNLFYTDSDLSEAANVTAIA